MIDHLVCDKWSVYQQCNLHHNRRQQGPAKWAWRVRSWFMMASTRKNATVLPTFKNLENW